MTVKGDADHKSSFSVERECSLHDYASHSENDCSGDGDAEHSNDDLSSDGYHHHSHNHSKYSILTVITISYHSHYSYKYHSDYSDEHHNNSDDYHNYLHDHNDSDDHFNGSDDNCIYSDDYPDYTDDHRHSLDSDHNYSDEYSDDYSNHSVGISPNDTIDDDPSKPSVIDNGLYHFPSSPSAAVKEKGADPIVQDSSLIASNTVSATGGINSPANTADLSPLHSSFKEFHPISPSLASEHSAASSTIVAPSDQIQHGFEKLKCEPCRFYVCS